MEKIKNSLKFDSNERDEFFRAIQLDCVLTGKDYKELIEHEKAHIEAIARLGHEDKIKGYIIERGSWGTSYSIDHDKFPSKDQFEKEG